MTRVRPRQAGGEAQAAAGTADHATLRVPGPVTPPDTVPVTPLVTVLVTVPGTVPAVARASSASSGRAGER
jgi:hypothetical protein